MQSHLEKFTLSNHDRAQLVINTDNTDIDGYDIGDFQIDGYHPRPFVKLEVAV